VLQQGIDTTAEMYVSISGVDGCLDLMPFTFGCAAPSSRNALGQYVYVSCARPVTVHGPM
jgi:hypothetical protein